MGQRKKLAADARKEARKTVALASLKDVPTSPRNGASRNTSKVRPQP